MKAHQLVRYCSRREQMGILEDKLKAERLEKYEKYQDKLLVKSGVETSSLLEEVRAGASEYTEVFESMRPTEPARRDVSTEPSSAQADAHPLASDLPAVKQWFLHDLDTDEQVFVMTVALFSGLERQELIDIYQDVLTILQPAKTQANEGV